MSRTLLPALAAGAAALTAAGATAAAHPQPTAHAARGQTITLKKVGRLGKVLTAAGGRTVYLFQKDRHGKSSCYGQCATFWPPVITKGRPVGRGGAPSSKLGTTRRRDGKTQATYGGHPLYYFKFDSRAGQATGEGSTNFGARWYVVNARGRAVKG
jgi:predicted lipoprotein with Yx(FWY)xxD motif